MHFQLVLTTFFKSELFSCLPKVDHVSSYAKSLLKHVEGGHPRESQKTDAKEN